MISAFERIVLTFSRDILTQNVLRLINRMTADYSRAEFPAQIICLYGIPEHWN
jgi:hypothetical protein